MTLTIPKKWRTAQDFATASDSEIEEFVANCLKEEVTIVLPTPLIMKTFRAFFQMFHCQKCGECCLGVGEASDEGISLMPEEVVRLADIMLLSKRKFKDRFTFIKEGRRLLKYPCPLYSSNSHLCTIYERRPIVCRAYPLNNPHLVQGLHPVVNGAHLMAIEPHCHEGRRVACLLIKA